MSKAETLCLSELGFHAATGIGGGKIGEPNPILVAAKKLGITYFRYMPDRFGDCIWLFNARNVPDELPDWIYRKNHKASDFVGKSAMTDRDAEAIEAESKL